MRNNVSLARAYCTPKIYVVYNISSSLSDLRDSPVRRYAALQCYVQAYITSYAAQESQSRRVSGILIDHAFIGRLWYWNS